MSNSSFNYAKPSRHLHLLFVGKGLVLHISSYQTVEWESLCRNLRIQFCGRHSDLDLSEMIRGRKQKWAEKFGVYADAILQLTDQLEIFLSGMELLEILKRIFTLENTEGTLAFWSYIYSAFKRICIEAWTFRWRVKYT